jgi:protein O-GlcNAc transferase
LRFVWKSVFAAGLGAGTLLCGAQSTALQEASQAFRAGSEAFRRGDLTEADKQFSQAVRLAPGIEEGHSALGVVLYAQGHYPQAIAELRTALKLKPGDRNAEESLAQAYSQTNAMESAIAIFENMDREAPLRAELLAMWARDLAALRTHSPPLM